MPGSLEISQGIDTERSFEESDQLWEKLQAFKEQVESQGLIEEKVAQQERDVINRLTEDIQKNDKFNEFSNPENSAQIATETLRAENAEPEIVTKKRFEKIGEGLELDEKLNLLKGLLEEGRVAEARIENERNPKKKWTKTQCSLAIVGVIVLLGLAGGLYAEFKPKNSTSTKSDSAAAHELERTADSDPSTEAGQTFISLLMQAATDAPFNSLAFKDFGISESTYQSLREQLLVQRDNISEEAFWQIMAKQTTTVFPPTGNVYSLGDHMLALDIQFNLLAPLYVSQPIDLDLDSTINSLAEHVDLNSQIALQSLYNNLIEIVPETSGANRLQRLVMVRFAIIRAIAKTAAPA